MHSMSRLHSQRGATLVVSLVLLLAVTVVGIANMKETVTRQQVINQIDDDNTAFQSAEFALRTGEKYLRDQVLLSASGRVHEGDDCVIADESSHDADDDKRSDVSNFWWKLKGAESWAGCDALVDYPVEGLASNPSFVIEVLGSDLSGSLDMTETSGKIQNYRITARGYGFESSSYVIVQSTYRVQY